MSTTTASSPNTYLPDPLGKFSRLPCADVILRSSDSCDLFVQKLYVVDSSPVLGEQIMRGIAGPQKVSLISKNPFQKRSNEQTTTSEDPSLPIVQLAESHAILSSLLTFVFPVLPVLPPTIEQILKLLSVAEKYQMTTALIRIRDCASRHSPPFIRPETALHVYSLARKYGLLKETLQTAEETLKSPMTIKDLKDNLDVIPSVALYELWQYRQRVLEDLPAMLYSTGIYEILSDADLECLEIDEDSGIPRWLENYLVTVRADPARVDLTAFHLAQANHVSGGFEHCEDCAFISRKTMDEFWTALTAAVRKCARKAVSGFSFTEGEIRFQSSTSPTTKAPPLPEGLHMQGADVVLRSSDLVSFRVHKSILAISSPFFNDMFSLPQPCDGQIVDGLPVVHVSEDAEVLHSLLTVLYPIPSMIPDSHENQFALLAALQKYEMTTILSTARSEIGHQLQTTVAPFRAYAIASSKQIFPEMEAAARLTLDHPMTFEAIGDALPLFEGTALHDLVHFRKRCRDKLLSFFEGFVDGSNGLSKIWFGCRKKASPPSTPQSDKVLPAEWLCDWISYHIEDLEEAYTNPLPNFSTLRKQFFMNYFLHMRLKLCSSGSCFTQYDEQMEAFLDQFNCRISEARDEEPFLLDAGVSNASEDLGTVNG